MLFAISMLFSCKSLNINMLVVEAAGVEPDNLIDTAQLIDSEIARFGRNSTTSKSTVRSLYSLFPDFPESPKLHLQTFPTLAKEHSEVRLQYFTDLSSWTTKGWRMRCLNMPCRARPKPRLQVLQPTELRLAP